MTGLEKIIAQINIDSENTAQSIIASCKAQCNSLIAEAKSEAQRILEEAEIRARKKAEDIIRNASSSAEQEKRKLILGAKQEIITSMTKASLEYLRNLTEDKYFEIILEMISKYHRPYQGKVSFNSYDMKRLSSDFIKKLTDVSHGDLTISSTSANIDGGFIISYGDVDVNCSFQSLFNCNVEKISDTLARLLFS